MLCDLKMPQVSGIEVFTALQRDAPVMARRVIFATGDASAEDVTAFLATVTVPVIEKPFDLADLEHLAARVASLATGRFTETGRGSPPSS